MATILLNYLGRKGAGPVFAYESAKYLKKSGHKVIALISSEIENFKMWQTSEIDELIPIKTYSNKVEFLINTISFLLLKRRKLIKKIKKENVEIIFCPMTHTWTYFINKKLKNIKKVVIVHDLQPHLGEYNLLLNLLNSLAYKNADYLIVLTKSFRELCAKKFKKNISNVFYMPHPRLEYYKFFEVERVSKSIITKKMLTLFFLEESHLIRD